MPPLTLGLYTYGTIKVQSIRYPDGSVGAGSVEVGKYCSLAEEIWAMFYQDHRVDWVTTFPFPELWNIPVRGGIDRTDPETIIIGNDVWIGAHVTLLSGAKIGDGAVIGAYSVVAGKIDPYGIAVGNPARIVKKRFSDDEISQLLEIRWWDWPREKIIKYVDFICNPNVGEFIRLAKNGG